MTTEPRPEDQAAGQSLLENAYRLRTPQDSRAYYDAFAPTYDNGFAEALGYAMPGAIAEVWHGTAGPGDLPVADIGCGTGQVAGALGLDATAIDGMDISAAMLDVARGKGLYRNLCQIDLTGPLDRLADAYGGVVSAGTFTHGHLGPGPLAALLGIARPGALFVIGVNRNHFDAQGFGPALEALARAGRIGPLTARIVPIYRKAGHDHSGDEAMILHYRKA